LKEFICLSCWETFEFSSADIRGKDTVTCPHCGAEQEVLDDVVGVNEGNLVETEPEVSDTDPGPGDDETAVDDLLTSAGIEFEEESESPTSEAEELPVQSDEDDPLETSDDSPGIEFDSSNYLESEETLSSSDFDPLDVSEDLSRQTDESDANDSGIELLGEGESDRDPHDAHILEPIAREEIDQSEESEEIETFDLMVEENADIESVSATAITQELMEPVIDDALDDTEIGTSFSSENAEENAALSRSVQELVSSITEREVPTLEQVSESPEESPDEGELGSVVTADTLDDLVLSAETLSELEAEFEHAGGLDFDLEGLEVDSETDIEPSDALLEALGESNVADELNEPDELESAQLESAQLESAQFESEQLESEQEDSSKDDIATEEPMGFALVSDTSDELPGDDEAPPIDIDEDELADAVSDLFEGGEEVEEESVETEDDEQVKSWRVRLKSGLVLSFPSLIVVQGWAADKDTSTIKLARGEGEFKPYEQVLGMMQTIETKALNPELDNDEEEEEEVIDGLSAAARAAAQRRRDGKMDNITAEYQFRKDAFKKQSSPSLKKPLMVLGLLIVLAGAAVALEFLAIVDLGLGFAPNTASAPAPPAAPMGKKKGPDFKSKAEEQQGSSKPAAQPLQPPTASDVCASLENVGVAQKGSCGEAKPEKISQKARKKFAFKLQNLPKQTGQVLEFGDKASFDATVAAFETTKDVVGSHRYQSAETLIFVQLNSKAPKTDGDKVKALLKDLLKKPAVKKEPAKAKKATNNKQGDNPKKAGKGTKTGNARKSSKATKTSKKKKGAKK